MTDIEQLRENVIAAAKGQASGCACSCQRCISVADSLDALDAALTPDPWQILRDYIENNERVDSWEPRVKAALKWREQNP